MMRFVFVFAACAMVAGAQILTPSVNPANGPNPATIPSVQSNASVVAGRFVLEDGSAPPSLVRVEMTCNSVARPLGWSDNKGYFSVQLTLHNVDNSADDLASATIPMRPNSGAASAAEPPPIDQIPRFFEGCDVRGSLGGYRSVAVPISGHRLLDSPDIGTIVLYSLTKVEGLTTSATTEMAPASAKKEHERAIEDMKKHRPDDAEKRLKNAVAIYPKYALAWFDLGRVYESREHLKDAADAYRHSIEADGKYVNPYERLYLISARGEKWADTLEFTSDAIRLDPIDYPRAYYFNAIANLNLGDLDAAEKSAREAVKRDLRANPRAGYVLGVILARKQNFGDATALLEAYLKVAPLIEVDVVKRQLDELKKYSAAK
jgi:tetratricopeptide (TPR) repeat protein